MFDISTNADELAAELERMARDLPGASERGLDRGAQVLYDAKQTEKEKTYARGSKRKRSGAFRDGDRIERTPGERRVVMTGPAAEYEEHLAKLPTGRDGVNRSNPAADAAFQTGAEGAADAVEAEIERVFE